MSPGAGSSVEELISQVLRLCEVRGLPSARDVKLGPYLAPVAISAFDADVAGRDITIAIEPRGWSRAVVDRMGVWAAVERERLLHVNQADFVAILVPGEGQVPEAVTTLAEFAAFLDGFSPPRGAIGAEPALRGSPAPTYAYQGEVASRLATYTGGGIVFVAMPFEEKFSSVFFDLIAPSVAAAGLVVMRTDQEPTLAAIDERIRHGIRMADIVVADVTGHNPNVFYELGIAHALGKRSLLLRQPETELPFDVRYQECFDYPAQAFVGRVPALQERLALATALLWANPGEGVA